MAGNTWMVDAAIRPRRDLLRPRHEEQLVHDGLRRVERMHPQREGLGAGTIGRRKENARDENRPPGEPAHHTQVVSDIGNSPQLAASDRLPRRRSRGQGRGARTSSSAFHLGEKTAGRDAPPDHVRFAFWGTLAISVLQRVSHVVRRSSGIPR